MLPILGRLVVDPVCEDGAVRGRCFCSSRASQAGECSGVRGADVELANVDAESVNEGDVERSCAMEFEGVEGVAEEFAVVFFMEERRG